MYCCAKIVVAFTTDNFGAGNGPISFTDVSCNGDEGFLLNCTFSTATQQLSHAQDVGVKCFNETGIQDSTHVFYVTYMYLFLTCNHVLDSIIACKNCMCT